MTDKKPIIANSGQPESLDPGKIFQRFSKVSPSSQGKGSGLAIVKKVTELYGWEINYKWENDLHVSEVMF